jgi:hypothetical protein
MELVGISSKGITYFDNKHAADFSRNMISNRRTAKKSNSTQNLTFIGTGRAFKLNFTEETILKSLGYQRPHAVAYKKCIIHSKMFDVYTKTTSKRCNSIICKEGTYYLARNYLYVKDILNGIDGGFVLASKIQTKPVSMYSEALTVSKISSKVDLFDMSSIQSKYFCVKNDSGIANIIKLPNITELE